ncbi:MULTISPECIES: hypothetical protein [unclassified Deinococcus]|uniref:hypothetical protein n=1 Tax=unclassified Deinococcus TaxID=2623546 RepID=UPI000A7839F5|nr:MULTISPECIES: hypothetical protein [unclassified Deinococcus]MCD0176564.1 hypothetical protein [Deinococcus sp. 14RED07]
MTDSNSGVKVGSLTVGLLGAWRGEATDPARSFQGQVVVSDLEALPVGTEVAVQFRDSGRRVTGAHDHGAYVLSARGREWPVSRFTAHASAAGQVRDDREPSGEWVAELVNR